MFTFLFWDCNITCSAPMSRSLPAVAVRLERAASFTTHHKVLDAAGKGGSQRLLVYKTKREGMRCSSWNVKNGEMI